MFEVVVNYVISLPRFDLKKKKTCYAENPKRRSRQKLDQQKKKGRLKTQKGQSMQNES